MFDEAYEQLRAADKEEFAHSVNTLMLKSFILRDYYDRNAKMMRASKEYAFIERNFDLVSDYLHYSGWIVTKDSRRGVISISNEYTENHMKLDLITSIMVFGLRYIYETRKSEESFSQEILYSSNELIQELINMRLIRQDKRPPIASLAASYRFLNKHNIITRVSGEFAERNLVFYINPSILYVIDNEMVNTIYQQIENVEEE